MKIQTGIWLDTKKAIIVHLKDGQPSSKYVASNIQTRERIEGESKQIGRFSDQYLSSEKNKGNRIKNQVSKYIKHIIEEIQSTDVVVLCGPANMKFELEKEILKHPDLTSKLLSIETKDIMTKNQMVAWVKNYFESL